MLVLFGLFRATVSLNFSYCFLWSIDGLGALILAQSFNTFMLYIALPYMYIVPVTIVVQ